MKCPKSPYLLFLWLCILGLCISQDRFAGPYQINMHQVEQCDETGTHQIYATSTRISKVSRSKYIYATNVTSELLVDDSVSVDVDFAKFGNGGWRPHFLQMEFPQACSSTKQMMPVLYEAIKETVRKECPIEPGIYQVNLDMASIKVGSSLPSLPYGKYRVDLSGRINDTLIGCVRLYMDIVPAQRRRTKKPKKDS